MDRTRKGHQITPVDHWTPVDQADVLLVAETTSNINAMQYYHVVPLDMFKCYSYNV